MVAFAETFIFGSINSLHCAGMCGPLAACAPGGAGAAVAYHAARTTGYALMGALAGGLGRTLGSDGLTAPSAWISFALAASLLLFAAGAYRHLGRLPGLAGPVHRAVRWSAARTVTARAATLGAVTPLLPCGLSWAMYAAAFLAGGPGEGALAMIGFALGSLPALAFAQLQFAWLRGVLGPVGRARVQRGAMLGAAAVLIWRGWATLEGASCCA